MRLPVRLSASVIVDGDLVVNAYGHSRYRPVGRLPATLEELERWQVDEILILRKGRQAFSSVPEFELRSLFDQLSVSTPISFGGGICSPDDAQIAIGYGVERVVLGETFFKRPRVLQEISQVVGDQAVVLSVPFRESASELLWTHPGSRAARPLEALLDALPGTWRGEILLMSEDADGLVADIPTLIRASAAVSPYRVMVMGGFRSMDEVKLIQGLANVAAICVGNQMHSKELLAPRWKTSVDSKFRPYVGMS